MSGLRHYQLEAKAAVLRELEQHRSAIVVMPTGTGKTQLFGSVVGEWPGRCLVLAHRSELIQQAARRIEQMTGEICDIEQAASRAYGSRIVVGSMQSVCQKRRLERLGRDAFGLLVVDECHRSLSASYLRIIEWFETAKVLGVTATPDRGDGLALGQVFESEAYRLGIREAIQLGWLVDVEAERVYLDEIDVSHVNKTAGDLQQDQLDEVMEEAAAGVAKKSCEIIGPEDGQGIAFFPGVKSAATACEWFNKEREGCAEFVCGDTPDEERDDIFRRFKRGEVQFLINVDIATEGFDHPPATWCIMARLTMSRARYAQCAGRVTRPLWEAIKDLPTDEASAELRRLAIKSSAKPACKILDFNGNTGRHDLVGPEDVLGGDYTEAEVKEAKKQATKDGEMDNVGNRLSEARKKLKRLAAEHAARVKARREKVDPWAPSYGSAQVGSDRPKSPYEASDAQKAYMRQLGIKFVDGISKAQAGKLITERKELYAKEPHKRPASGKQIYSLRRFVDVPPNINFESATKAITYIKGEQAARRRPDLAVVKEILG